MKSGEPCSPALRGRLLSLLLGPCLAAVVAGCATTAPVTAEEKPMHTVSEFRDQRFGYVDDPWESFNRSMYNFNYYFDKYFFLPVISGYEFITPTILQTGISNLFSNLGEVRNFTNNLLQGKPVDSLATLGRFVTNSTIGLGGLFDPATPLGLERRYNDFGLTLGHWGAGSGPYLVMPILGPSTLRDTTGWAVDSGMRYGIYHAIDPFESTNHEFAISAGIVLLEAVDKRHQESFRYYQSDNPFEYYMVRFFYHQKRNLDVLKGLKKPEEGEEEKRGAE
ncbi:VacJ family lipoprotein [Geobacter sp. SVR]|uniref:MlaA family lipoprotein n=1 Tax=Geobacter sp. SVR TaxID=2495594 RepID=UPI00143EFD36|nr:VacJ family lipoprotein [Geobacter sp. SVR]BCS54801.1 hypothetical protein GSVR_31090 [Geobacter sp. SVR]GCF86391.1 hypothetical protein GSbR_29910 [Geobacter sp. SVR]